MNYMGKLAVINYKIEKVTKEYKKNNNGKYYIEYLKLMQEKEKLESIIDNLYYTYQNAYNIHKILEIIKNNKLNKIDTIKYFDYLYKSQFKVSKYYTKQYKNRIVEV